MIERKTIYYENAVVKVYIFPILYSKVSHPDPSVDRRSGFLQHLFPTPKFGFGVAVPCYTQWLDKKFASNSKYMRKSIILEFEYHQDLIQILADFGYTEGYKCEFNKRPGKNTFFLNLQKILK